MERRGRPRTHLEDPRARRKDLGRGRHADRRAAELLARHAAFRKHPGHSSRKITDAASEAGFDARWVDAGGASDGNHMAEAGIPVVDGCGPAGGGFHLEREFLRLETVEERINMIVNLLKRL
ncbi:MAG: M20/M25/M40 family metallo-hydrolase [Sutterella wadsworthensis]